MVLANEALPLSVALVGNVLVLPTLLLGGACNLIWVAPAVAPPAQFLIQVVMMSAQAWALDNQQLWPPPTLTTISDWSGCERLTTVRAALYARLTSSERANCGVWPPAWWQLPQRSGVSMYCQRLTLKACTSAVAGAGPV